MLEMAGSLQNLRHAMANQGVSCIMAHHACAGRDERWKDMERLEGQCTQQLESWKLEDRTAMKAEAPPRLLNSLRETGGNIILACTAEVPSPPAPCPPACGKKWRTRPDMDTCAGRRSRLL